MNNSGIEIERKFLIAYPGEEIVQRCVASKITQTYLEKDDTGMNARVRKREYSDKTEFTHTKKKHISDIRRVEEECEITETEYLELLKTADKKRSTISKIRYCMDYCGHVIEIDVYPFWDDRAVMEIELSDEAESYSVPEEIKIIKEITEDKRYTNSSLAKEIPFDNIFRETNEG